MLRSWSINRIDPKETCQETEIEEPFSWRRGGGKHPHIYPTDQSMLCRGSRLGIYADI